jgi:hypothetical protein
MSERVGQILMSALGGAGVPALVAFWVLTFVPYGVLLALRKTALAIASLLRMGTEP